MNLLLQQNRIVSIGTIDQTDSKAPMMTATKNQKESTIGSKML